MNASHEPFYDPLALANNAELDEVLAELERAGAEAATAEAFYPRLLEAVCVATGGDAASFWRRVGDGMRRVASASPRGGEPPCPARRLRTVCDAGRPRTFVEGEGPARQTTLVCPVRAGGTPVGVLVCATRASGGVGDALLDVLAAFAESAEQHELNARLASLESETVAARQARAFSLELQGARGVAAVARTVAEEGRRLIGCDRLTVAVRRGGGWRVAAVSGVEKPSPRSDSVRAAERLVTLAARCGETVTHRDGEAIDQPPQLAEALEQHVETGLARELRVVPCRTKDDDSAVGGSPTVAALLIEQFEGRLPVEAAASTTLVAEHAAAAVDRVNGAWGGWRRQAGWSTAVRRCVVVLAALAAVGAAAAALVLTPAELRVAAEGRLVPSERARVFAPMDATVDRVLVDHGDTVAAGQALVELRSERLEMDLEQAREKLAITRQEIAALETAKLRAGLPGEPLTIDVSEVSARIESLRRQTTHQQKRVELLERERRRLVVVSPLAGRVTSWRPNDYLADRPVRRGQRLIEVAAVGDDGSAGSWTIEIDVPDRRAGRLLAAAAGEGGPLEVDYVMKSAPAAERRGRVLRVASITQADASGEPVVRIDVDPLVGGAAAGDGDGFRSGATVLAKVRCGEHSLGHVWFHEAWDAIQRFWF